MANIVVTQIGNSLKFVYNDEEAKLGNIKKGLNTIDISEIDYTSKCVVIEMSDNHMFCFTGDATSTDTDIGIVDTVNAVTTDTDSKLFDELIKTIE